MPMRFFEKILNRITHEDVSVTDSTKDHRENLATIYESLKDVTESSASALEIARLRRENPELKLLVADMVPKLSDAQKGGGLDARERSRTGAAPQHIPRGALISQEASRIAARRCR